MKRRYILFVLISILICFCGCDRYSVTKQYPWYRSEQWHCSEIDMTIDFSLDENGELKDNVVSQFTWNGQTHSVSVGFQANAIAFLWGGGPDTPAERILNGGWAYDGDYMIVTIIDDSIFSGKFDSLTFIPVSQAEPHDH